MVRHISLFRPNLAEVAKPASLDKLGGVTVEARKTKSGPLPWIALITVWFVWGSTYLGIGAAVETIPPMLMAGVRFLIAGLIVLAVVVLSLLAVVLAVTTVPATAETGAWTPAQASESLNELRDTLQTVQERLQKNDGLSDSDLVALRNQLLLAQEQAQETSVRLEPELLSVTARLSQLGPVDDPAGESEDIARQRAQLQQSVTELDAATSEKVRCLKIG